jgi:hypothetical protein
MKSLLLISLLTITTLVFGQDKYPFEKYPSIKYTEFKDWKIYQKTDRIHFTLTIPGFFSNTDSLTIQLTSFETKWDSSYIRLFRNKIQIQKIFEPMFFTYTNVSNYPTQTLDVNGDDLTDVKLLIPYMGNGLASLNQRVIYLFQKAYGLFTKVSYLDKMGAHISERDFDNDSKFEILTMTLKGHENHNYWTFNIYNFKDGELVNQNDMFDYPIMIQYLFKDNFKITENISREKMKMFRDNKPDEYSKE